MDNIVVYNSSARMGSEVFDQYFTLLCEAFPKSERRDRKGHLSEFDEPHFNSVCYQPDDLKGFINYWNLDGFIYIEHFAVVSELRGQGIGAELMSCLRAIQQEKVMVLEAEPPQDSAIAARRIDFYRRLGFALNPYPYIQPAMMEGEQPIPLVIMSSPLSLSESEFIRIRNSIYENVYKFHSYDQLK